MESWLVKIIQFMIGKKSWVRLLLTVIARFGYLIYVVYGMVEWFRPAPFRELQKRRRTLLYCLFSVMIGSVISFVIGRVWQRPRPFVANKSVEALIPHKENASFPSNHTANSLAISLHILQQGAMGILFLAGSIFIGFSRVYSGIHYVTDIMAGMGLGITSYLIVAHRKWAKQAASYVCYGYAWIEAFVKAWWHVS